MSRLISIDHAAIRAFHSDAYGDSAMFAGYILALKDVFGDEFGHMVEQAVYAIAENMEN